ncbi:MAG TPA: hypothetical protein VGB53_04130 [Rubricoccaceae bacterium]
MSGVQHRRRLWRFSLRRAARHGSAEPAAGAAACPRPAASAGTARAASPPPPATTRIDALISAVDHIASALSCATGRPLQRDPALRQALLNHAAGLAAAGMPQTAAMVRGLVDQIDEESVRRVQA